MVEPEAVHLRGDAIDQTAGLLDIQGFVMRGTNPRDRT